MSDQWNSGYVTEIEYTHGFYPELTPQRMSFAALSSGTRHRVKPEGFKYVELGIGQGLSFAIHAAANKGEFWGNDFNPAHVANCLDLLDGVDCNATVVDDSFEEMAQRSELKGADIIAFHGIWTWISQQNRDFLISIAKDILNPGGMTYASYNVKPGWSSTDPVRHLMTLFSKYQASGGIADRASYALEQLEQLSEINAKYFLQHPGVSERVKQIKEQKVNYLTHEYLNEEWHIMPFSEIHGEFEKAKLDYATTLSFVEHVDAVNYTDEGREFLARIANPVLNQSVRDFLANRQFRKDLYIRGPRSLDGIEQVFELMNRRCILTILPENLPESVAGYLGEAQLNKKLYDGLIEIFEKKSGTPKRLGDVFETVKSKQKLEISQFVEAIRILLALGAIGVAKTTDNEIADTEKSAQQLNANICERSLYSSELTFLASPVTGSGHAIDRFSQMFMHADANKIKEPAKFAWEKIQQQGQKIVHDGETLDTEEENLAHLEKKYAEYKRDLLPLLKKLAVV